jgi:hypothetical protein
MSGTHAELEEALEVYKARMLASNRAFWTGKVHALEQDLSLSDTQRLDILVRYFGLGKWSRSEHNTITRPSQILIPPGQPGYVDIQIDLDRTISPAPEEKVKTFLENLRTAINQNSPDPTLEIPEEYRHLLRFTDAISDIDFRQSGEPQFTGTCGGLPSEYDLFAMASSQREWKNAGWTVVGGWRAGFGEMSEVYVLHGKKDGGTLDEQQLAWRIWDFDIDCMEGRWFPSIAAYLLFRCDWLGRLPEGWQDERPEFPVDEPSESEMDDDDEQEDGEFEEDDDSDMDTGPYQAFDCMYEVFPESEEDEDPEPVGLDESSVALSLEDRISKAVKDFESKQKDSISQWLHARIKKIEHTPDEAEAVQSKDRLAKSFKFDSWSALSSEHQLSSPRDLLSLDPDIGQRDPGTRPPVPDDERRDFLKQLTAGINQVYDPDGPNFYEVPLPEDYGILLSITDGIRDNDLRDSGICGVDGVRQADISRMAPDETEKLPWGNDLWRRGWELSTGFCLGFGRQGRSQWLTYYYCSRVEKTSRGEKLFRDPILESEKEWKWRLFYKEPERFRHSFLSPKMFDGIAEWLRFYQCWWDREVREYPKWHEQCVADVKLRYPRKKKRVKVDAKHQADRGDLFASGDVDIAALFEHEEQ